MKLFKVLGTLSFFASMWLTAMSIAQLTWVMILTLTLLVIAALVVQNSESVATIDDTLKNWKGKGDLS